MKNAENKNKMETIAERIRRTRTEIGLTQEELARACGVSRPFIGLIEQGQRRVTSPRLMDDVANALHVHTLWLTTGDGEKRNPLHKTTPGEIINDMIATTNDDPDSDGPHDILEDISVEAGSVLIVRCGYLEVSIPRSCPYSDLFSWVKIGKYGNDQFLDRFLKVWFDDGRPADAVNEIAEIHKEYLDAFDARKRRACDPDDESRRDVYLGGDN